jgi:alpha-L-arabinofuranosidase
LTETKEKLTVAIVNPTDKEREIPIEIKGARIADKGKQWVIAGTDPMACNEPGKEPQVTIVEKTVLGLSSKLTVPGYSVSIFELEVE